MTSTIKASNLYTAVVPTGASNTIKITFADTSNSKQAVWMSSTNVNPLCFVVSSGGTCTVLGGGVTPTVTKNGGEITITSGNFTWSWVILFSTYAFTAVAA